MKKRSAKKASEKVSSIKKKMKLVLKTLIFFVLVFVLSLVIYTASDNEIAENLFLLFSIIFGFVSIAFLIVLLVLFFFKLIKK